MKKKKDQKSYFSGGFRNFLIVFLLLIASVAILDQLTRYSLRTKEMSYSNFLKQVEQNNVASVTLRGQDAYGKLNDGTVFETVIVNTPYLWDSLRKAEVDVNIASPSSQVGFWYIVSFLLALGLLGVFWYIMRQSRNQGSGGYGGSNIFSMGKSRARMFMPSTIKRHGDNLNVKLKECWVNVPIHVYVYIQRTAQLKSRCQMKSKGCLILIAMRFALEKT